MELYNNDLYSDGNLLAYYRLNGNANAAVGTPNGTASNVSYVTGKYGQGASFNGSSSSISFGNNFSLNATDFSIVGWINVSSSCDSDTKVFCKTSTAGSEEAWYLGAGYDGSNVAFNTVTHQADEDVVLLGSGSIYEADTWYHVAWTNDIDGSQYLYVNAAAITDGSGMSIGTNSLTCYMGRMDNTPSPQYFAGILDDFALFNRVLSANEIASLYGEPRSFGVLII